MTLHESHYARIPYGLANFRRIRMERRLYVDKTRFLHTLEQVGRQLNGNFQLLRHVIGEGRVDAQVQPSFPLERLHERKNFLSLEPLAKRVIGRVFPCRRRRGEGRSAGGMQRSQDGSDRAREAGDTGVHGACLPVMRASAREERWRISFTSRSSLRLFSIHSR